MKPYGGKHNKTKTHCNYDHEFTDENTRLIVITAPANGKQYTVRQCKKCLRRRARERYAETVKDIPCSECGETGRLKGIAMKGQHKERVTRYFCHDEEKSCYNYRRGTYFADLEETSGANAG